MYTVYGKKLRNLYFQIYNLLKSSNFNIVRKNAYYIKHL